MKLCGRESEEKKMEIGTKILKAFLERVNANTEFKASDLDRLGQNLTGPIWHRDAISAEKFGYEILDMFLGSTGLWVLYFDHELNFCLRGPDNSMLTLPFSANGNEYYPSDCRIRGICNGLPVTTLAFVGERQQYDEPFGNYLFLGYRELAKPKDPFAAVRDENTIFYTTWSPDMNGHADADLVIWQDGEIDIVPWIENSRRGIDDLCHSQDAILIFTNNCLVSYVLDSEPHVWHTMKQTLCYIADGKFTFKRPTTFGHSDYDHEPTALNTLLAQNFTQVTSERFAILKARDQMQHYRVTLRDPTGRRNDENNGSSTPSFYKISNLYQTEEGEWIYFGYFDGAIFKMKLNVEDDRIQ
ncbi:hypothetical protein KJ758_01870 [Patescibacteria group bacterium]|nr:hypothetical protein [Patescibacteria group bacterium]